MLTSLTTAVTSLSSRERLILALALLVAIVFALTRGIPLAQSTYAARADSIDSVELDIEREQRLLNAAESWAEKRAATEEKLARAEAELFRGATAAVVEANIQRAVSQHAANAGITVNSTRLAESVQTGEFTAISQELSFRTNDASATVAFLRAIDSSVPALRVAGFNLDRSRSQFSGAITVVGFARLQDAAKQAGGQAQGARR